MHQCSSKVKAPVLEYTNEARALDAVRVSAMSTCEMPSLCALILHRENLVSNSRKS